MSSLKTAASAGPLDPVEDDMGFSLTPTVSYRTRGGDWFFAASGSLGWNHYSATGTADGGPPSARCHGPYCALRWIGSSSTVLDGKSAALSPPRTVNW